MKRAPVTSPERTSARRRRSGLRARGRAGMTLIELLVALLILSLLMTMAALGTGAIGSARLRTSAVRLAAAMRFAYVHALTTNHTTRVSIGLNTGEFEIEDTDDAHTLDRNDPLASGSAEEAQRAAEREANLIRFTRPRAPRAHFEPVTLRSGRRRPLEPGVVFSRVYTEHDAQPREEGHAYVYFFSGGLAERAVVHLRSASGELFSVVVHPLTGRAEILDRPVEPTREDDRAPRDDVETDNRGQRTQDVQP